jgi:hypothetical protein
MEVVPDVKGITLVEFASRALEPGSQTNSDVYHSYRVLAKEGFEHDANKFDPKESPDHLHWLHTVISNAKVCIGGTKHLQSYLNEFAIAST